MEDTIMKDLAIKAENITKIFYKTHKKSTIGDFYKLLSFTANPKNKDAIYAVNDLSLELKKGEIIGIIGNNGSGKSTLLRILCGIMMPTSGRVFTEGDIASFFDIGCAIVPELTGNENIFILGKFQGLTTKRIKEIYSVIAEFSELGDFLDTPVKYYSSGMVMRLAFSVLIHTGKDIFLFDEVFSVGDILFRIKCQSILFKLKNEGRSMIIVSHNLSDLAALCDKIYLLNEGKIIASGYLEEILKKYNDLNYRVKDNKSEARKAFFKNNKSGFDQIVSSTIKWSVENAPGDDTCRLLSAELLGLDVEGKKLKTDISLKIQARFSDFNGAIGLTLSDMLDHKLFGDISSAHGDFNKESLLNGDYDLLWKIPITKLNPGLYKITLHILDSTNSLTCRLINVLSFEVDFSEMTDFKLYTPLKIEMELELNKHPL